MSSRDLLTAGAGGGGAGEQPVEIRRYLDAIRRSKWLIAAIVVVMVGVVLGLSLKLPKTYEAHARVVYHDTPSFTSDDASARRELVTAQQLLLSRDVIVEARRRVPAAASDPPSVDTSVDSDANIINIVTRGGDPQVAAAYANAVAEAFLDDRAEVQRERLRRARAGLEEEIERLRNDASGADQVPALRERLSQLAVSEATVGSEFEVGEEAQVPGDAASPRPVRNSVIALFVALFIGVLVALGRDQLVPRVTSAREMSTVLDIPLLAGIPHVRRRFSRRRLRLLEAVEDDAYATLAAVVDFTREAGQQRVILVTGPLAGQGKTTVTAHLGRALVRAGRRTLVISADVRNPRLHEHLRLEDKEGLVDVLQRLEGDRTRVDPEILESVMHTVTPPSERGRGGYLHAITSGSRPKDPVSVMSLTALRALLKGLQGFEYDYVLFDGPPLLGLADSQVMAQAIGEVLVVTRLPTLRLDDVIDLRDVLRRLDADPLGLVVIGTENQATGYYTAPRTAELDRTLAG